MRYFPASLFNCPGSRGAACGKGRISSGDFALGPFELVDLEDCFEANVIPEVDAISASLAAGVSCPSSQET